MVAEDAGLVYPHLPIHPENSIVPVLSFPSGIESSNEAIVGQGPFIPEDADMGIISGIVFREFIHDIYSCHRVFGSDLSVEFCTQ